METSVILRSFHGVALPNQQAMFFPEKLVVGPTRTSLKTSFSRDLVIGRGKPVSSTVSRRAFIVKASEATTLATDAATLEKTPKGSSESKGVHKSTFPNGLEALVLNVCDETSIAELKLKEFSVVDLNLRRFNWQPIDNFSIGTFELHLKRDIGNPKAQISAAPAIASPTTAPPIPSEPMIASAPAAQSIAQKNSSAPSSPFANVPSSIASKLAALEASGAKSYVLVSSPTVGTFRSGRTLKGKKQPPSCREGDMIKEGQIIGYLDQFGNELPIRSDMAGEVLKLLVKDGEAVGYGDPLVAVLPSFHGIK